MPDDDEYLLERLHAAVNALYEMHRGGDALAHDKIVALAEFSNYVMGLTQPVSTSPSVSSAHSATLNCPRCSGSVSVTLS